MTVISASRRCFIQLLHRDSDPSVWIVRRWKKFLWFRKRLSSDWFIDEQQARMFALELKRNDDGGARHRIAQEIHHAV